MSRSEKQQKDSAEKTAGEIRSRTRRRHSSEETIYRARDLITSASFMVIRR